MSTPGPLFRPFDKLVKIAIGDKEFEVPEGNMLLRDFQYLSPEDISYGRFCWNEVCQEWRVSFDMGEGTPVRNALACKLIVEDGMRLSGITAELRYCLRDLKL